MLFITSKGTHNMLVCLHKFGRNTLNMLVNIHSNSEQGSDMS